MSYCWNLAWSLVRTHAANAAVGPQARPPSSVLTLRSLSHAQLGARDCDSSSPGQKLSYLCIS
eukprot:6162377-Amphidinium_carterae.1